MEFNKSENFKVSGSIVQHFKLFKDVVNVFFKLLKLQWNDQKLRLQALFNLLGNKGLKLNRSIKRPVD